MDGLWLREGLGRAGGGQETELGSGLAEAGRGDAHPGTGPCPRGRAAPRVPCAWAARTAPAGSPLPRRPHRWQPPSARTPAAAALAEVVAAKTGASEPPAWRPRACCGEEGERPSSQLMGGLAPGPGAHKKDENLVIIHKQFSVSESAEVTTKPLLTLPIALCTGRGGGEVPGQQPPKPSTWQPDALPEHL